MRAEKKAQKIAELSGLRLGEILEFTEVKEIDNLSFSLTNVFVSTQSNRDWNLFYDRLNGQRSKAIVVKFEVKK